MKSETFNTTRFILLALKQNAVAIVEPMKNRIVISIPHITPTAQIVYINAVMSVMSNS